MYTTDQITEMKSFLDTDAPSRVDEALSHLATVDETLATIAPPVEEIVRALAVHESEGGRQMTFFILFGYDSPREYPRMRRTGWCEVTAPDIEAAREVAIHWFTVRRHSEIVPGAMVTVPLWSYITAERPEHPSLTRGCICRASADSLMWEVAR